MTDDMPENLLHRMPEVDERIVSEGIHFRNAYVSQSLCCPSRASILTGMYPHNTGVLGNSGPRGGVATFREQGLEQRSVAIWLTGNGYRTGFVGKYMNGYDGSYVPPGWSYWYGRYDSGKFANENGQIISQSGQFEVDVQKSKALAFLDRATDQAGDPPFALFVWTLAPHLPARYAPRHANLYNDEVFNPPPSFNEADVSDKPQWVRDLPPISDEEQAQLSELHRNQLRSLRSVDEMVGAMLDLLQERSELENTYVVFTTDNGVHMGEHRWWLGSGGPKSTAYEEAAGAPLAVRGPGIPVNQVRRQLALNNDFAPTFADIADAPVPEDVDGRSLLPLMNRTPTERWRTAVLNERLLGRGGYHSLITNQYTYVEYKTGERELYDRQEDPYQLSSIHRTASPALLDSLHARLVLLKACAGQSCRTREDTP